MSLRQQLEIEQEKYAPIDQVLKSRPDIYKKITIGNHELVHRLGSSFTRPLTGPEKNWKIIIPPSMIRKSIQWFHRVLRHPGAVRMFYTMARNFYFPNMKELITDFVKTCDTCQKVKLSYPPLGHVPEKLSEQNPWEEVQVDIAGPWQFKFGSRINIVINAITAIDPFLGLCEIRRLNNMTGAHTATKFHEMWISRYPKPIRCLHDNGSQFISPEFVNTLNYYGIKSITTTVQNPQANSIIERMHLSFGMILRSFCLEEKNNESELSDSEINDFIDSALASTQHAINTSIHMTTRESPGALAYNRDMFLPLPTLADWECIRLRKQQMIHRNNLNENKRRKEFDRQPGMEILIDRDIRDPKLQPYYNGPFTIQKIHTNGTVTIKKNNIYERINIRRIKPYHRRV